MKAPTERNVFGIKLRLKNLKQIHWKHSNPNSNLDFIYIKINENDLSIWTRLSNEKVMMKNSWVLAIENVIGMLGGKEDI